jgi:chitinase
LGPYAYKDNQWVSFDDQQMLRRKVDFIKQMDIGGGMIWALDLDDFRGKCGHGKHPLLKVIHSELQDENVNEVQRKLCLI